MKNDLQEMDRILDSSEDYRKGLNLYSTFIEGGSADIHTMAGLEVFNNMHYDASKVDTESLRCLDLVFSPSKNTIHAYKGLCTPEELLDQLSGTRLNHSLCSLTTDKNTAWWYATKNEVFIPVLWDVTIKKGVPIARPLELLGEGGMKNFEKEITVGREVYYDFSNLIERIDKYGDPYYTVDVIMHL